MKMEKLTGFGLGMAIFAGCIGFACSQQTGDEMKVGTTQVELRSDLTIIDKPVERADSSTVSTNSSPQGQPITRPDRDSRWQDPLYDARPYDELLLAPAEDTESRKSVSQNDHTPSQAWTQNQKNWMQGGKGFGVAAEARASTGTVHVDDAGYYSATETFTPVSHGPAALAPTSAPFKNEKPLVFHSRATGFAHEPPVEIPRTRKAPTFETQLELSPIPETRVYLSAQPKSEATLVPAENRLDLMNGNNNLNRDRFNRLP